MKDIIIIGGGPAALTAALYLGRYERETLLVTDSFSGQTAVAGKIENYPGFSEINGYELIAKMKDQVKNLQNVEIRESEKISDIKKIEDGFSVKTQKSEYEARKVIIATGRRPKTLGLPNEDKLIGRGISYCATCDGPFAKEKDVVIVGGGYAATEAALILSKIARSITMLNITSELTGEAVTLGKVKEDPKIKVVSDAKTIEIVVTEGTVSDIKYQDTKSGKQGQVKAQMIFVEIGQIPNSDPFAKLVDLDHATGEITIDLATNQTSVAGVYAVGDVTNVSAKQIVVACGEGAKVAVFVNKLLNQS